MRQPWICLDNPVTDHVKQVTTVQCSNEKTKKRLHIKINMLNLLVLFDSLLIIIVVDMFAQKHMDTHTHPHTSVRPVSKHV